MFRADLHCHSTCSDGMLTPEELVLLAKERGLQGLSITDHDTFIAYERAYPVAKKEGLLLGIGVEFSSLFLSMSVHILGYDFDPTSVVLLSLCSRHKKRRQERNMRILKKLQGRNMPLSEEELLIPSGGTSGRLHIARLMVKRGYVQSVKEAFDLYLGDGKCCFDPGEGISSEETIETIHQGGGKAFLAHPHLIKNRGKLNALLKLPFDGIECYYMLSQPKAEAPLLRLAKERRLLISGGSDFHAVNKDFISLGGAWVDEPTFHAIFSSHST